MNDLINIRLQFVEDAITLLNGIENNILLLEKDPDNYENIQEIYRVMHSLKGVSSMYEYPEVTKFTHYLETLYSFILDNNLTITSNIIDYSLSAIDIIKSMFNNTKKSDEIIPIQNKLISQIEQYIQQFNIENTIQNNTSTINTDIINKFKTYYIIFRPEETFFIRKINIIRIFKDLTMLGKFYICKHNFDIFPYQANNNDTVWGIILSTQYNLEDIEDVFMFIIDNIKIIKLNNYDFFDIEFWKNNIKPIEPNPEDQLIFSDTIINNEINNNSIISENTFIDNPNINNNINNPSINLNDTPTENITNQINQYFNKQYSNRITVDSQKLDQLMYLVSELVTTNSQLNLAHKNNLKQQLDNAIEKIDKLSKQFRENALGLRLVPLNDMVIKFKRLIRDMSKALNKEIKFITQGTETELDKTIINILYEPIMHIIRNCIDHGIESPQKRLELNKPKEGIIKFSAFYSGSNVFIQIQDDGTGIDTEFILKKAIEKSFINPNQKLNKNEIYNLIFIPGFSTAQNLTEVSGRGMGMDIVKKKISDLRGEITIDSEIGLGTIFTIKIQQTVSIIDTLLIQSENSFFMIPLNEIEICERNEHTSLYNSSNNQIIYNEELIPFIHLRSIFNLNGKNPIYEKIIIVNHNNVKIAIIADKIIGEYQAVLKPLGKLFKRQPYLLGVSIMGDGNMAIMLDTEKLQFITYKLN